MAKVTNNCDDIKNAPKKNTNISILPYKTAILHGAISIITDYKKNTEDGIDYKSLCEKISKYVNSRKKCVRQELKEKGKSLITNEWKTVITSLLVTFNTHDIKSLCYLENDNEVKKKKDVLNIHNAFRDFCIEKKNHLRNSSDMDFEECDKFLSWISEKKMELQVLDPNYEYIKEYQKYFDIRDNCNYPWLLKDAGGVTCQRLTRTRARDKDNKQETLNTPSQSAPAVTTVSSADSKKNIPLEPSTHSKGEVVLTSDKSPESGHEKTPVKSTASDHSQSDNNDAKANNQIMFLSGTPVDDPPHVSQSNEDYENIKFKSLFYYHKNHIDGQIVPHDVHDTFKKKLTTFRDKFLSDIQKKKKKKKKKEYAHA
ncbi:hypothetical protein POVWA2_082260 [Plasmodium ovale wallikeri]|uniref:STP1 protein n=1 Tax=Plasmodium ovale wallikeri TaxID=864142 RepID=A0A1A9ANW1_PLAOA|nr:hypothetical protein POVWA2_082260 [Plasmodium ovale wallikeri]